MGISDMSEQHHFEVKESKERARTARDHNDGRRDLHTAEKMNSELREDIPPDMKFTEMAYEKIIINEGTTEDPKKNAGFFSLLTFWWMNDVFRRGAKRPLEESDLLPLQKEDETRHLTEKIRKLWEGEKNRSLEQGKKPHLWKCILKAVSPKQYTQLFVLSVMDSTSRFLNPLLLGLLVSELISSQHDHRYFTYAYAVAMFAAAVSKSLLMHHRSCWLSVLGIRLSASLKGVIYQRILRLSDETLSNFTTGQVMNLVSNDVQRMETAPGYFLEILQSLYDLVLNAVLMWYFVGWQSMIGLVFLMLMIPFSVVLSGFSAKLRGKTAAVTDRRVLLVDEVLKAIRVVKINCWERINREKLREIRREEIAVIRQRSIIQSVFAGLYFTSTVAAILICVVIIWATQAPLTPFKVFLLMALMYELRPSISLKMMQGLSFVSEAYVSLERMQTFLLLSPLPHHEDSHQAEKVSASTENLSDPDDIHPSQEAINCDVSLEVTEAQDKQSKFACIISKMSLYLNDNCILKNIDLEAEQGALVVLSGPVGSGKSSLLRMMTQEGSISEGSIWVAGTIAYVPQIPWIFSGTVRENILFGETFDEGRFKSVVKVCALETDLDIFPESDQTVVGERGAVLSGGQRARIGLARAVYADSDVYLLDDPLSAVDPKVKEHIFQRCFCEFLSTKTRLFVTNEVKHMKNSDQIVLLSRGAVLAQGNFMALRDSGLLDTVLSTVLDSSARQRHVTCGSRQDRDKRGQLESETKGVLSAGNAPKGLEISEEGRRSGTVSSKLYWKYFRAGNSIVYLTGLVMILVVSQLLLVSLDAWLAYMVKETRNKHQMQRLALIYVGIFAAALLFAMLRAFLFYHASLRSSEQLHDQMALGILKAPVLFFDTNPIGRILNRFSKDIGSMDEVLPTFFLITVQLCLSLVTATILPSVLNPWILLAIIPTTAFFLYTVNYYLKTTRELKRLEAVCRSPVFSHFSETLNGLNTIRSRKREKEFVKEFYRHQDKHNQPFCMVFFAQHWMGTRVDLACALFIATVAFASILISQTGAWAGLSLVYISQTLNLVQFAVHHFAFVENEMTSVERVVMYTEIEPEPGYELDSKPPKDWPRDGSIIFKEVSLRYYPDGPQSLKNISFTIEGKAHVGVAGRTGAGKSSLIAALLRMPEATGFLEVDGVDIASLNLLDSRKSISVLGQTPHMFSGPVRRNLDPLGQHGDADLWRVLELVQLKSLVDQLEGQLEHEVSEGGANLSVGERQLLCLARVLLQRNTVVILDEPTAHVDPSTEKIMQNAVREHLKECTVITVAHRLDTIRECDKILVMESGAVAEFGSYEELMRRKNGVFARMAKTSDHNLKQS